MEEQVKEILEHFNAKGNIEKIKPITLGNINNTFVVKYVENNKEETYLLQEINRNVFPYPEKVMENIQKVTSYLKEKFKESGDIQHTTLEFILAENDELFYRTNENRYFRLCYFIQNTVSYNSSEDVFVIKEAGKAFGNFQKMLDKFPIETLHETIEGFHDTPKRYQSFLQDVEKDRAGRVEQVQKEISEIKKRADKVPMIMRLLQEGKIPYRVTHNDTKLNNVLMAEKEKTYKAVIDLDTIIPGSALFDYGDGIRSTAASAFENEADSSKVYLNLSLFQAYTEGYLSEMANYLNKTEVQYLGDSILLLTLEQSMRFLQDYINGDIYFKTEYLEHNLVRTRNQLTLLKDMEEKEQIMKNEIQKIYERYKKEE